MIVLDECDGSESDIGKYDVNNNFNMDLPKAYDSHFHMDRTAARLWDKKSSDASVEQLLDLFSGKPIYPVDLVGGLCVYANLLVNQRCHLQWISRELLWAHTRNM